MNTVFKPFLKYFLGGSLLLSSPVLAQEKPLPVAELTVQAPAKTAMQNEGKTAIPTVNYFYGFQQGDQIVLDLRTAGSETVSLEIKEYASGSVIYSGQNIGKLKSMQIPVPHKAVYEFIIHSDSPKETLCKLFLQRIPAAAESKPFNPHVTWQMRSDTTYTYVNENVLVNTELAPQVLVDKTFRVFSQASYGNPSRVTVPFKLPPKTKHWVYWLGVGQESVKQLEETTKLVAKGGGAVLTAINPVAAFGMGLLPYLPQVKSSGYVDYLFMNSASVAAFEKDGVRKPYPFAQGNAVVSDYGKITAAQTPKTQDGTLYFGVENKNTITGLDVVLKIVAFAPEDTFQPRRVKKILKVTQVKTPVFGD